MTTLLKPDATIEQGYSYDEYGNATVENSASLFHNEMSYTGAISDSTTGLTYMNARYYNPATGTFTSQDTYYGSAYSPWTQHLYSYTGGNPVNYVDPTGHTFAINADTGSPKKRDLKYQEADDILNGTITVTADTFVSGTLSANNSLKYATRPNNIGTGTWTKFIASQSDELVEFISKTTKFSTIIGIIGIVSDPVTGIIDNVTKGTSAERTVSDAVVDFGFSSASYGVSIASGAATGALIGSIIPGVGTVVGGVIGGIVGGVIGLGASYYSSYKIINGKSIRDHVKDYVYKNRDTLLEYDGYSY